MERPAAHPAGRWRCGSATRRRAGTSRSIAALITACVAQTAIDIDEGRSHGSSGFHGRLGVSQREIEENLWRAIRHGMDGEMIDFRDRRLVPTRAVLEDLVEWTEPRAGRSGSTSTCRSKRGTAPALRFAEGAPIEEIYRRAVEETRKTTTHRKEP